MKKLFSAALCSNGKYFDAHQFLYGVTQDAALFFCSMILIGFLFTGCKKQDMNAPENDAQLKSNTAMNTDEEFRTKYDGLDRQTLWELQQARAATARYRNIKNAIKDGYSNIMVDVENMGHHYMNSALVDATFDIRRPEILVYNKNEDGSQELVAVEYAVPLTNPKPEGFTGSGDVWNGDSGFPLWLVHAWVWSYNPDGVFNWTNPLVHLQ
jgi:hypothetical protein